MFVENVLMLYAYSTALGVFLGLLIGFFTRI